MLLTIHASSSSPTQSQPLFSATVVCAIAAALTPHTWSRSTWDIRPRMVACDAASRTPSEDVTALSRVT